MRGGTYSNFNATECINVQDGYMAVNASNVATLTEAVAEIKCTAGTYSPSTQAARTECIKCDVGYYSSAGTSGSCTGASAEKYVVGADGAPVSDSGNLGVSVRDCLRGSYSADLATECTLCEAGKYSDTFNSTADNCTSLPAGHYGAYTTDSVFPQLRSI